MPNSFLTANPTVTERNFETNRIEWYVIPLEKHKHLLFFVREFLGLRYMFEEQGFSWKQNLSSFEWVKEIENIENGCHQLNNDDN